MEFEAPKLNGNVVPSQTLKLPSQATEGRQAESFTSPVTSGFRPFLMSFFGGRGSLSNSTNHKRMRIPLFPWKSSLGFKNFLASKKMRHLRPQSSPQVRQPDRRQVLGSDCGRARHRSHRSARTTRARGFVCFGVSMGSVTHPELFRGEHGCVQMIHAHMRRYVCMYASTHIGVFVLEHVYICIYIYIHFISYIYIYVYMYIYTYIYILYIYMCYMSVYMWLCAIRPGGSRAVCINGVVGTYHGDSDLQLERRPGLAACGLCF